MSVRNRTTASQTPIGSAMASVARTSPIVSIASRTGRLRPRVSRSISAVPAGSIAAPTSPSSSAGSTPRHRASESAAADQPARRMARSSFGAAWVASSTVASAGQPTTRISAEGKDHPGQYTPGPAHGDRVDQPGRQTRDPAHSRNPASRIRADVFSYASATHASIFDGSGEYSSSIEMAASGISSCRIASR